MKELDKTYWTSVRTVLEQAPEQPMPEADWQALADRLPPPPRRRRIAGWWLVALGLMLGIVVSLFVLRSPIAEAERNPAIVRTATVTSPASTAQTTQPMEQRAASNGNTSTTTDLAETKKTASYSLNTLAEGPPRRALSELNKPVVSPIETEAPTTTYTVDLPPTRGKQPILRLPTLTYRTVAMTGTKGSTGPTRTTSFAYTHKLGPGPAIETDSLPPTRNKSVLESVGLFSEVAMPTNSDTLFNVFTPRLSFGVQASINLLPRLTGRIGLSRHRWVYARQSLPYAPEPFFPPLEAQFGYALQESKVTGTTWTTDLDLLIALYRTHKRIQPYWHIGAAIGWRQAQEREYRYREEFYPVSDLFVSQPVKYTSISWQQARFGGGVNARIGPRIGLQLEYKFSFFRANEAQADLYRHQWRLGMRYHFTKYDN